MALVKCLECKKEISSNAGSCPNCGFAKPKKTSYGCGTLILIGILGITILGIINPSQTLTNSPPNKTTEKPEPQKTPEQILAINTQKYLATNTQFEKDHEQLKKFYSTSKQFTDAAANIAELRLVALKYSKENSTQEQQKLVKQINTLIPKLEQQLRVMLASNLEQSNMERGVNMTITASGADQKVMTVTYALMSQAMLYQLRNTAHIDDTAEKAGFTQVIYTNGFEGDSRLTWKIDLTPHH